MHGGTDAPYVFVNFPERDSWDVFKEILEKVQIVTTPGVGFGPAGQGFVRVSVRQLYGLIYRLASTRPGFVFLSSPAPIFQATPFNCWLPLCACQAFGKRDNVLEACERFKTMWKK